MKLTVLAPALTLSLAALAPAADPAPSTPVDTSFLKKFAETRRFMLGRPQNVKVAPDGKTVLFLRAEADRPALKLFEFDVATGKTKELLSPQALLKGGEEHLTPEEKARRERMRLSAGGFADFHFDRDGKTVLLPLSGKLFLFERATAKVTELKTGTGGSLVDPKFAPDGTKVAYVRGFDVYVIDLATNTETAVTTGGTALKTHGLAEFVAQEEMGRFTGYWWSPDGTHIAYEEADHTGVETWYVADPFKPDQKPAEQFYPRPGKKNVRVKLGITSVGGGKTEWVDWDSKYEYLANVRWDPVGPLTVLLQDRAQRELALLRVDPATGRTTPLVVETGAADGAWLSLSQTDLPRWFPNEDGFLWVFNYALAAPGMNGHGLARYKADGSRVGGSFHWSDGFRELVAFDPKSGRAACLTTRNTQLTEHFNSSDEERAFQQRPKDPNPTLASLTIYQPGKEVRDDTWTRLIDPRRRGEIGLLSASFSGDLSVFTLTATDLGRMPRTTVHKLDVERRVIGELPSVAAEPDLQPNVKVEKVGDFWTAVVRPRDFDPKKKYPVILDVYGGPKHLHVVQAMRNWLVPQWLADQGFIVVAVDNRGTPGRGRDWERAIYQQFGTVPLEDQVKGLNLLCEKFPELDKGRVGIVGWSFGGYMAANGVLRQPDVFKAAVAGAPVADWEDYDTHYTERYMGLRPESQKAYDAANLIPLAKDLKRPLLLVHGTADDNVYYRHSLKLADALFRAGRDFESLPLPGVTHMYTSDPVVMERLWARTAAFFRTHLGAPK